MGLQSVLTDELELETISGTSNLRFGSRRVLSVVSLLMMLCTGLSDAQAEEA